MVMFVIIDVHLGEQLYYFQATQDDLSYLAETVLYLQIVLIPIYYVSNLSVNNYPWFMSKF